MKKRPFILGGCVLLVLLLLVLFLLLRIEGPKYLTLEIPMPQYLPRYAGKNAVYEEFSTFVSTDVGHRYFVYSMYVPVRLGHSGFKPEFETENDVENYYDEWLKKLGWKEANSNLCNPFMLEFQPHESYRAYVYPAEGYPDPTACLVAWFEYGDGEYLDVLIKTINPSWQVLWDSD